MAEPLYLIEGQDVELAVNKDGEMHTILATVSRIEKEEIHFRIHGRNKQLVKLKPGIKISVIYADQVAMYNFEAFVLNADDYSLNTDLPAKVNRTQRRNFVRIDVNLPLEYFRLDGAFASNVRGYETTTKDLSGGGFRFNTDVMLSIGTELEINLDVPKYGKVTAIGQVVRCIPIGSGSLAKYSIGVEFKLIDKKDRENIIRYLFERQRELRQKGLI